MRPPKAWKEEEEAISSQLKGFATDRWPRYGAGQKKVQAAQRPPKHMVLSNTLDSEFCVDCLEQALQTYGMPS